MHLAFRILALASELLPYFVVLRHFVRRSVHVARRAARAGRARQRRRPARLPLPVPRGGRAGAARAALARPAAGAAGHLLVGGCAPRGRSSAPRHFPRGAHARRRPARRRRVPLHQLQRHHAGRARAGAVARGGAPPANQPPLCFSNPPASLRRPAPADAPVAAGGLFPRCTPRSSIA